MTKLVDEAARLMDTLPPDKAQALIEYARFLAEKADQEAWERKVSADFGKASEAALSKVWDNEDDAAYDDL